MRKVRLCNRTGGDYTSAPSGTDYRFFTDHKGTDCVLTLFGRRKGFISYTNNLTYMATEILPGCTCAE